MKKFLLLAVEHTRRMQAGIEYLEDLVLLQDWQTDSIFSIEATNQTNNLRSWSNQYRLVSLRR